MQTPAARRMSTSMRHSQYKELPEFTTEGLHAKAFELFRKHIAPGASVLDLGSGSGAWAQRLHDASYAVIACDLELPEKAFPFSYRRVDLNADFAKEFASGEFAAVSVIEVIEHLENPRHLFRQLRSLLQKGGVILLTTPNASGLYSRLRFFFTGKMSMFTNGAYVASGHITPLTAWQLEKIFAESGMQVLERRFHDSPFFPPRALGDLAKIVAWVVFRAFMFGTVGGQNVIYILRLQ
jgi:2-polyprenyl-3-methyl-5-hydroxy-6-metoxy-1,4-benzoquinol methylase